MKSVFLLWHVSSHREDEQKLVGVYDSAASAEAAQKRAEKLPGFCWDVSGFCVDEYLLGEDHWLEGFETLTVIHVPVNGNESELCPVGAIFYPVKPEDIYEIFDTQDHADVPLLFEKGDCVRIEERLCPDGKSILVAIEKVEKPTPPNE